MTAAHRLEDICCFAYERTVANDNTVHLGEHLLQVLPGPRRQSYAKARVMVRVHDVQSMVRVARMTDAIVRDA